MDIKPRFRLDGLQKDIGHYTRNKQMRLRNRNTLYSHTIAYNMTPDQFREDLVKSRVW